MFLKKILKRNPNLIDAAIRLHQEGKIPANCYLLDLDHIQENAEIISKKAKALGLRTYYMTKQISRNPMAVKAALDGGIDSTVAVSAARAKYLHQHELPVGHVGHLSQIPKHEIKEILAMNPEMWTVYSVDMAVFISREAVKLGVVQPIIIKVADRGNMFLPGQDSGIWVEELKAVVDQMKALEGVVIIGVTAFPCVTYDVYGTEGTKVTANFKALHKAKKIIEASGCTCEVFNTPGNTSYENLELFAKHGGTHVEPGHGITGTTPAHIYEDLPEIPAVVYVSEVSHRFSDTIYAYGGGLYVCIAGGPAGYPVKALIGDQESLAVKTKLHWHQISRDNIDYYAMLTGQKEDIDQCQVGDTVVFGFRPQAFVTRAYTAAVRGIKTGNYKVEGIY